MLKLDRILGLICMPVVTGMLFGAYICYSVYTDLINTIDSHVIQSVDIEYGRQITLNSFFTEVPPNTQFITNVSQIDMGKLASYDVFIDCGGHVVHSVLNVVDKTPPVGKAVAQEVYCGEVPAAEDCVTDVFDMVGYTIEYDGGEPALDEGGEFNIPIRLTDTYGNVRVQYVPFTVKDDQEGPEIMGLKDLTVELGGTLLYKEGVEVVDDYAENPTLTIDNTAVDLNVVGNYPVTYKAVDDVGNVTEETITVSVVLNYSAGLLEDESYEEVVEQAYEMAAEVLDEITDLDNKTDVEIAMDIFYWVYHHVGFSHGSSDYTSWAHAAVKCFEQRRASCYGRWAICKAMLDVAGIDNICVERGPNPWQVHYWCLVYLNGGWYHCDPQAYLAEDGGNWGNFVFMCTDAELKTKAGNHDFEGDLYPERSTDSVQGYFNVYTGTIYSNFPYIDEEDG